MLKILNCGSALKVFERSWQKGLFQTIYPAFSAWLQSPAGEGGMAWAHKALRQFDVWKKAGLKPMPSLQHALLFGPYIESVAAAMAADGLPEFEATMHAVNTVLRDRQNMTQIPKTVVFDVERILGIQVQMRKSSGQSKYATRLRQRHGFDEALIYLKFASGLDPSRKDLLAQWIQPADPSFVEDELAEASPPPRRHPPRKPRPPHPRKAGPPAKSPESPASPVDPG
jgi:tRNA nucleotidyltransferase/poly(A) polymerase